MYDIGEHTVKVKAVDLYGAESDWQTYTFKVVDVEAATISFTLSTNGSTNFNIKGNGNKTTYSDMGYSTVLKVGTSETNITNGTGSNNGVTLNTTLENINDGNYVKITYKVRTQQVRRRQLE